MRKVFLILALLMIVQGCFDQKKQAESILRHYLDQHIGLISNYSKEISLAWWYASVSGQESDYKKLIDMELDFSRSTQSGLDDFNPDHFSTITKNVFSNEEDFELLQKLKNSGLITDTLLSRQLIYLYHTFRGSQIEAKKYKKFLEREVKLSRAASSVKLEIDGKLYGPGKIDSIRQTTTDSSILEKIARAYQQNGKLIAPEIINLVKERNKIAATFGFPDYYHLVLEEKDQSPEKIKSLIAEIEPKTSPRFFKVKEGVDKKLAKQFGISVQKLQSWHYNNVRNSYLPQSFILTLDSVLSQNDPIKRASGFFEGIGLPIQNEIDKSELQKGNMNATIVIDFNTDIRMVGRIPKSYDGLFKIMHEAGHVVHYKNISEDVPYLLKGPSLFIAEGIACYFGNMTFDPFWLNNEVSLDEKTKRRVEMICRQFRQIDQLYNIRKRMVLAEFEREIYADPDQDLDLLWHDLNWKYLGINYPKDKGTCFWATTKYFSNLSCNIQNYIVADVFAAQLKHAVNKKVLNERAFPIQNNKTVGKYLVDNLFKYGDLLPWEMLVVRATGESLNSSYFIKELVVDNEDEM